MLALVAIMVVRAVSVYDDVQLAPVEDLPQVTIDEEAAVKRFAGAIRFRTVSHDDRSNFDGAAFIAFRDYLRTHEDARNEYEALKRQLAVAHAGNTEAYADAKSEFVQSILRKAGIPALERDN